MTPEQIYRVQEYSGMETAQRWAHWVTFGTKNFYVSPGSLLAWD